ncbi:MAG: uroporphyrinogen-III C-methyltransferase [Herminiimonas sp.]|nr:uroporphyrinogen-III C-methyltransferase [Herminiimonas sp.]
MSDLPSFPQAGAEASRPAGPAFPAAGGFAGGVYNDPAAARLSRRSLLRVYIALALLALLLVAVFVANRIGASNLRDEVARHLKSGDTGNAETRLLVKTLADTARELQAKVTVLESKQVEAQSQQLALEQLYQDLSKNRDDWALAEIEQVLSTASQQLQLAGNVPGALIALQNADARLSRSDKPQFIVIRRALSRDIDRLKALPSLDLTGIALRLDSIIGQIDGMPLLADEKPTLPATEPKKSYRPVAKADRADKGSRPDPARAASNAGAVGEWSYALQEKWQSLSNEMWSEVRQLIRVRSVEVPDALLLSPSQAYYARENLKLRLLNARLALLARNESAFRSDMIASQEAIIKYFDTRARQTQTAQALLRQVQGSNLAIELPTLAESLNAVRNYKAKL